MSLLESSGRWLRRAAVAAIGLSLASCSQQVKTESPLDYIGPDKGAPSQPVLVKVPGATQPASAAIPATVLPYTPPVPPVPGEAPAGQPGEPVPAPTTQPVSISIADAVLQSLESNQAFVVERYRPRIARTRVEAERAQFDPGLSAEMTSSHRKSRSPADQPDETVANLSRGLTGSVSVDQFLPTGTSISVDASTSVSYPKNEVFDEFFTSRIGANVTQPLLRGFGLNVNLASLRQAGIDVKISQYELRGFAEDLVARVQETYWDYALAQQQIAIVTQSLELANKQLNETTERVNVGQFAETELAAPTAEVATREEALINARSNLAQTRLTLIRLLNPGGADMWDRDIIVKTLPSVPEVDLGNVEEHVAVAMRLRPDLNQARLAVQKGDIEVVRTKNGLLPRMDLFVTAGRTGYSDSFGGSTRGEDGLGYDVQFGGVVEYPPLNRAARAAYTRAVLSRDQQIESVRNAEHLAQVDVRSAYIEVIRARQQVTATAATRKLQEEKLRAETEKFRVGRSTSLLVAAASRDLLASQISEVQVIVAHLKALISLYRLEGTLLARVGIQAPGFDPTTLAAK